MQVDSQELVRGPVSPDRALSLDSRYEPLDGIDDEPPVRLLFNPKEPPPPNARYAFMTPDSARESLARSADAPSPSTVYFSADSEIRNSPDQYGSEAERELQLQLEKVNREIDQFTESYREEGHMAGRQQLVASYKALQRSYDKLAMSLGNNEDLPQDLMGLRSKMEETKDKLDQIPEVQAPTGFERLTHAQTLEKAALADGIKTWIDDVVALRNGNFTEDVSDQKAHLLSVYKDLTARKDMAEKGGLLNHAEQSEFDTHMAMVKRHMLEGITLESIAKRKSELEQEAQDALLKVETPEEVAQKKAELEASEIKRTQQFLENADDILKQAEARTDNKPSRYGQNRVVQYRFVSALAEHLSSFLRAPSVRLTPEQLSHAKEIEAKVQDIMASIPDPYK